MGRRKRKQDRKYAAQFAKTWGNKRRRFIRFTIRIPHYTGPVPMARSGKGKVKEKVL